MSMLKKPGAGISFYQSIVTTLGGFLALLPVWIWVAQGDRSKNWTTSIWVLFGCLPIFGIGLIALAIISSRREIHPILRWRAAPWMRAGYLLILAVALAIFGTPDFKRKTVEILQRDATGFLALLIITVPVYFILKAVFRRRK